MSQDIDHGKRNRRVSSAEINRRDDERQETRSLVVKSRIEDLRVQLANYPDELGSYWADVLAMADAGKLYMSHGQHKQLTRAVKAISLRAKGVVQSAQSAVKSRNRKRAKKERRDAWFARVAAFDNMPRPKKPPQRKQEDNE